MISDESTGVEAGLSGEKQILIALQEIIDRGGTAYMVDMYWAIEESLENVTLSDQGRASLRRCINSNAVKAGFIYPYDKKNPGWRITQKGRRYILDSSSLYKSPNQDSKNLITLKPEETCTNVINLSIQDISLPVRFKNVLLRAGINNVGELNRTYILNKLSAIRGLGTKGLNQIQEYLAYVDGLISIQVVSPKPLNSSNLPIAEDLIHGLPVSIFFPFLLNEEIPMLAKSFSSVEEIVRKIELATPDYLKSISVLNSLEAAILEMKSIKADDLVRFLLTKQQNFLSDLISQKIIHPRLSIDDSYAAYWLQKDARPDLSKENLRIICNFTNINSITFEIEALITLSYREIDIIFRRYRKKHSLQTVADNLDLSRERIRQIEKRAIGKLWRQFSITNFPLLKSSLEYARDEGVDFKFDGWYQSLGSKQLIYPLSTENHITQNGYGVNDFLQVLILTSAKDPRGQEIISQEVRDSMFGPN